MMRGTVRLGAIGLAFGLIFMAMAPTGAKAVTSVSIDKFDRFPDSKVDHNGDRMKRDDGMKRHRFKFRKKPFGRFVSKTAPHGPPKKKPFGHFVAKTAPHGPPKTPVGPPKHSKFDGHVTHAPEPATWLMMIAGFWIVAWRLRHRGRQGHGLTPANA